VELPSPFSLYSSPHKHILYSSIKISTSHKNKRRENEKLCQRLLEGKTVNLKVIEKEDLLLLAEWSNNAEYLGDYIWLPQQSRTEWEKRYDSLTLDTRWFFIEKKDGTKIGTMFHWLIGNLLEISCVLVPNERGKGYGVEATKLMVDYLFFSRDITRIQAHTDERNVASQKVLQKAGFKKESTIRKSVFSRGEWKDRALYSILREEWKEPKILTKPLEEW
jgi:RimJ/RimL family protein N-acetyltransferase